MELVPHSGSSARRAACLHRAGQPGQPRHRSRPVDLSPACAGRKRNISTLSRHVRAALIGVSTIRDAAYPKAISTRKLSGRSSNKASPPFAGLELSGNPR
jgi:hypothetical protein